MSPGAMYRWTGTELRRIITSSGASSGGGGTTPPSGLAWDWSDTNTPMAAAASADPYRYLPAGSTLVPLSTSGADFKAKATATVSAAGQRVAVRLPGGPAVGQPIYYDLTSFGLIGNSGSQTYAFGLWLPNLQGFYSLEPGGAVVRMAANSMTQAQLDALSAMTKASFSPNQMGLIRIDGSASSPIWCYNIGFAAFDQNPLTSVASDLSDLTVPQSAPHQGVTLYTGAGYALDRVWADGAGKAMNSQPPFEHADFTIAKGTGKFYNLRASGRRGYDQDPNQTRQCSTIMLNNETSSEIIDSHLKDSNVSRLAINDQNVTTAALATTYKVTRTKLELITVDHNAGRGGYTNASLVGYESSNASIIHTDNIYKIDNVDATGQTPCAIQLTTPGGGAGNPAGGRFRLIRGTFRHPFAALKDWATFRIPTSTHWWTDGLATTLYVEGDDGQVKTAWTYTGAWTNSAIAAAMASAGVNAHDNFMVRNN